MDFSAPREIVKSCKLYPSKTAFYINGKRYTYAHLLSRILSISNLINQSEDSNPVAGVFTNDSMDSYASIFACWYSGKAYLPLNPGNPAERNLEIIRQAGLKIILADGNTDDYREYSGYDLILLDSSSKYPELEEDKLIFPGGDDLSYVLFTSGSTGKPKGVPIHFKALNSFLGFFAKDYRINSDDRFLQIYDLSFDGAIPCYISPLCFGSSVYTVPQGEIKYLHAYKLMRDHELTVIKMTPTVLNYLRPYFDSIALEKVKYSIFGGEAFPLELAEAWSKCVPNAIIQNVYGPTESTVFCLRYEWESGTGIQSYKGIVSLGKATGENEVTIKEKRKTSRKKESPGEICIRGPQLFSNYWKNPVIAKSNKTIGRTIDKDGFYKTGDIAICDKENNFFYIGRNDSQVKIQGFRVELSEIEQYTREFVKIHNVVAIAHKNAKGIPDIHLFIESEKGDDNSLLKYLNRKLPDYMIPGFIHYIHKFPLSLGGKINKIELKKRIADDN